MTGNCLGSAAGVGGDADEACAGAAADEKSTYSDYSTYADCRAEGAAGVDDYIECIAMVLAAVVGPDT